MSALILFLLLAMSMSLEVKASGLLDKDILYESRDSVGRRFILTFMDNHQTHTSDPFILITAVTEGVSTVKITAKDYLNTVEVHYGSSAYVDLPNSLVARTADSHNVAVEIISDKEIHVSAVDSDSTTTDGFQALPVDALDKEYYVMSFDAPSFEFSEFVITAVVQSTTVNITLSHNVVFQSKNYPKGDVITRTLDLKETIQLQSFGDITGTHIIADFPVALQSGTSCAFVPASSSPCDHLVEFIPPVSSYGYEFALAPFIDTQPGFVYRILAAYDNTTFLDSSSSNPVTINAGEHTDYIVSSLTTRWITSSKPILVAQFIKSGRLATGKGDPAMVILPAVEQYTGEVIFTTFNGTSSITFNNHISIISACRHFQNGAFLLSTKTYNKRIDYWRSYPFGNGMCCKIGKLPKGTYTLRHTDPNAKFLVLMYGINTRVSYLLPTQFGVDRITYKSDDGQVKTRNPTIGNPQLECQFEEDFCGWTLLNGTNTHWDRKCGLLAEDTLNVPSNGVGGNECDYYTYIRETGSTTSFSKTRSPDFIPQNEDLCISVNFFMAGSSGTITTYLVSDVDEKMIWTRRGNHGNFWHPLTVTINGISQGKKYYLSVEALAGTNFTAAVDGIIVGDGPCGVGPAKIARLPMNATTKWGVSKQFFCEAYGHPMPEIKWYFGLTTEMENVKGKFEISDVTYRGNYTYRKTFTIHNISSFDNGEYFCKVYNSYRSKVMTDVAVFTLLSFSKAEIVKPPKTSTLNTNINHTLECSATGGPPPKFKWFRIKGSTITEVRSINEHISVSMSEYNIESNAFVSRLNFFGIMRDDDGTYRCQVKNVVNKLSITREEDCRLNVLTNPDPPSNLIATRVTPNSIQLTWNMLYTGHLPVTECILKYIDSSKIEFASQLVHISVEKTKFLLGGVDALTQYNISLSCSNKLGVSDSAYASFISKISKSAIVTSLTNNAVSKVGTPMQNIECLISGAPAPTITWFKSPFGSSTQRTKITESGKYTISDVLYKGSMMYSSTLTLNNIENSDNMNYYCQASNDRKLSERSTSLKVIDIPGTATNIQTENDGDNSLVVTWTIESTGNLPLEICYVAYIDSNANTLASDIRYISGKYNKIRISYLRPSAYYNITIACSNSIGYGPPSSQAFARVSGKPVDGYTSSPAIPKMDKFVLKGQAISISSVDILISWSVGTYDILNIKECIVIYRETGGTNPPIQLAFDVQMYLFTLGSLKPETSYNVTLKCTNMYNKVAKTKLEPVSTKQRVSLDGRNSLPRTGRIKNPNTDNNSSSSIGLGIGLTLLVLLIIIVFAAIIVKFRKRQPPKKSVDENGDPLDIFS